VSVVLVPYHRDFLELVYSWREDPEVQKYNPLEALSLESLHAKCSTSHSDFADFDNAELFFWLLKAEEKIVGNISVRNINRRMLTAEIGYGIAAEARGNGYATEAVRMVTQKAFTDSPLRKLIAYVHQNNLASRRVLKKVGYKPEGVLREHYIVNGIPMNEIIYGILRREIISSGAGRRSLLALIKHALHIVTKDFSEF
jgi:[ribosomal protein S5]-alanine N-acetyltransferase